MPWLTPTLKASDPTSLDPIMLRMMMKDSYSSLYLGRPCYNGIQPAKSCSKQLWTHKRYSEVVVSSMTAAIENYLEHNPHSGVVLIGHSGGGTLAMLIAMKLSTSKTVPVIAVATLAGNLDIELWAKHHNYTPLAGSMNPMTKPALDPKIAQIHFAGIKDSNIPISLIEGFVEKQHQATLISISDFDHHCCWESQWPSLLKKIDQQIKLHLNNQ
ncbi:alpha/beta fold hydrolase [Motiliproteus sp. MSK22-1]|uniref:alpha/beta fold hydrolase n=1 Tax=Motiliproteus sp. MSK22-1 TaxID=1897630 RepID=UPI001300FA36|nr:hypothetical protein [Motiliproteus sp. MSK22-1]